MEMIKELNKIAEGLELKNIEEALYFPKYFQIETIHYCDGKCEICPAHQWDTAHKYMKESIFKKVADEIASYSQWVESVCLARAGEPLLDEKLTERIAYLKDKGIKEVTISTNAAHLTERKAEELLKANLDDIMITFDSINKQVYESIKGFNFETVLNNILTFIRLRNEIRPDTMIRIRTIIQKQNLNEIDDWKRFWLEQTKPTDRVYAKKMHSWGNQLKIDNPLREDELTYHPCVQLWSSLHIASSGEVPMCVVDYDAKIRLGNVKDESIVDIWRQGRTLQQKRNQHARGLRNEIEFCKGCKIWDADQIV